jgi:outer membrane protein OmpA-like peptidoglycan-associated protein
MKALFFTCFAFALLLCTSNSTAQILNPKNLLKKKAVDKTNQVLNKRTDQVVDTVFNKTDRGVDTIIGGKKKIKKSDTNQVSQIQSNPDTTFNTINKEQPSLQTYSKFDFVPGEKVIFFDDFSQDNIGDFPTLWNTNGSAEIVTTNLFPGRWMKFVSRESIWTDELLNLPDNYTIEFDLIPIKGENQQMAGYHVRLLQSINAKAFDHGSVPGKAGFLFKCEYFGRPSYSTYINGTEGEGLALSGYKEDKQFYQKEDQKYHISIWVQKARVRLYQNQNKIIDLPKAFPIATVKLDRIRFEDGAALVSNIRIAVGNPDMRSKLITEGKLVSYGIYFDINSDQVKPESYGTIRGIADVLIENTNVKIKIVGHTDADGNDAANLDLSKRRALAVKNELVKTFGIDASRIETDGKGEVQPVAANDTPSNKALNRRVEFLKQ